MQSLSCHWLRSYTNVKSLFCKGRDFSKKQCALTRGKVFTNANANPILGIESFIENGFRPSLIPLLTSYFSSREMQVKWHGKFSESRKMPGSGAIGSNLGNLEFDSQTNKNANCVPEENRFKFVDDLTTLEVVNLLNIGISSLNVKTQVPNDLPTHGQFVNSKELKSQVYLNEINRWTENQQMIISSKKTKAMVINFTNNLQFHTRLQLKKPEH